MCFVVDRLKVKNCVNFGNKDLDKGYLLTASGTDLLIIDYLIE